VKQLPDRAELSVPSGQRPLQAVDPLRAADSRQHPGLYHVSKWGAEGFFESVAGEVAPFGVGITLVEPGAARTRFGRALTVAREIAQATVDSVDVSPAPLRLPLGSDAYAAMHGAISGRLAQLEAARPTALSTDVDAHSGAGAVTHSGRGN
jgi:NAD(P)-dependent dehydrogenase (short-subunit alcohol dehydrogenase family)